MRAGLREPSAALRAALREEAAGLREPNLGKTCYVGWPPMPMDC